MKKILSIMLVLAMMLSLAGCKKEEAAPSNQKEPAATEKPAKEETTEAADENNFLVSDKEIEFSVFEYSDKPFDNKYPVAKKLTEMTNVKLKGVLNENTTDAEQAYNLMVSSGEVADLVMQYSSLIFRDGLAGAYLPLQDLVDEHAPNIQKMFEKFPYAKKAATGPDGNLYFIPGFSDGKAATGFYIRQDWLDNLGLEVPKTMDEYYTVLKAFKDQDANGNGDTKDEIPFFARDKNVFTTQFVYMWDAHHEFFIDENNQIQYGELQPEFKDAVKGFAKWYKEGLIDPEIFTRGGKARDIMLNNNTGGSTHDWFGSTASYNDKLKDSVPGFNWQPMLPPASPSGKVIENRSRNNLGASRGAAISSKVKDPVAAIKFIDFCFSEEGRRLLNFGIEGEDYNMVDGQPTFTEEVLSADNVLATLRKRGAQISLAYHQDFNYEKQWINKIAVSGMEMYIDADCFLNRVPEVQYTEDEQTRFNELNTAIKTYVSEYIQKWVLGVEDIDDSYDTFVKELKNMGIDELVKIQNDAYQRFIK